MTDYSELVRKMRTCIGDKKCFEKECRYWSELGCIDGNICCDAAAAIEDMAKHITEMHERVTVLQIDRGHLETEVKEWRRLNNENLLPKRGEWELIDEAEPMRWGCSRCKYLSWETSNYCPRCGAKMEVQE